MITDIIFDLGGVVAGRDKSRCPDEINKFFSFLAEENEKFPPCWVEFDRGMLPQRQVAEELSQLTGRSPAVCNDYIDKAIQALDVFPYTEQMIRELASEKYRLYVLSNMSLEFYSRLKTFDVFRYFHGQVVSCYEHRVKPDPEFYKIALNRFNLIPETTLFIDDKLKNVEAAAALGIRTYHFTDPIKSCDDIRSLLNL